MKQPDGVLAGVSRETEARLRDYLSLLLRWNTRINLIARAEAEVAWARHILDSAQLAPLLPAEPGPLVDLGSGAGFPGLVLALLSGRDTHLVESDRRKCAFLQEAARLLGLTGVTIHPSRIEAARLPLAAIVSARALAPLPTLLGHAHRILSPGGIALFPKGRTATEELTAAAADWTMRIERFPSRTDPDSTILRLSEIRPVSAQA
ncbi:MAG: 16S rRNA (guanine(527)-N(7))-methyltransferase [uncultured Craurococcus sp.]|uniref:Ribosomal RNA small subunit methyltransferase G n=1 Tax=uncultured Craurococcus sp. TaxID=1135998 RepID=A0A6J4J400_9PROT|nr:MAG: 16S rRNA (guanine(527)-N(7))-methyltransferase [uncultured Craurococcus sp.]